MFKTKIHSIYRRSLLKLRQNFFLQYQYNIKQTSYENEENYKSGDYKLIQFQIL